jgi:hypothetical protein
MADGRESARFPKPDWSPERFRSSMYTCHLSVLRRSTVTEIGGFRVGFDGSQDHDLILRATERITAAGRRVVHLPVLAYQWRNIATSVSRAVGTLSSAVQNGRQAVQDQVDRLGLDADVVHGPVAGCYRLVRRAIDTCTVTIVVATRFEGAAVRPYRSAVEATVRAGPPPDQSGGEGPKVAVVVASRRCTARADPVARRRVADRFDRVPVGGEWHLASRWIERCCCILRTCW